MRRHLTPPIQPPDWREGFGLVRLRDTSPGEIHALLRTAYDDARLDTGLHHTAEGWWWATRTDAEFDPDLCLAVRAPTGQLAAFALVWNSSFIKDLVVAPQWQRRGIATALLGEIFSLLSARGFDRVELKVLRENLRAKLLYRRAGFVEVDA